MKIEDARGVAARCWCDPRTSKYEMNPVVAEVFAERIKALADAAEMLWVALANVSGGDYWRDNFFSVMKELCLPVPGTERPDCPNCGGPMPGDECPSCEVRRLESKIAQLKQALMRLADLGQGAKDIVAIAMCTAVDSEWGKRLE